MKIQYDKEADAKYITLFADREVAKTIKKEDWLLVDQDKKGDIIGIEILDSSKHQTAFFITDKFFDYFLIPEKSSGKATASKVTKKLEQEEQIGELNVSLVKAFV